MALPYRRAILYTLLVSIAALSVFRLCKITRGYRAKISTPANADIPASKVNYQKQIISGLELLRKRQDSQALAIFEEVLVFDPDNPSCLWGKAEILRRIRRFKEAETILTAVCRDNPCLSAALISLSYIRYMQKDVKGAIALLEKALSCPGASKNDQAMAYILLGMINSYRSQNSWFLGKIAFGSMVKGDFLKAKRLAQDLPEAHLALGTFYLLAPRVAGGSLEKAVEELGLCLRLAPDFATANARLAQAYKKMGDARKYELFLKRAVLLDPENEVVKELNNEK